jgi:hypothetical protein
MKSVLRQGWLRVQQFRGYRQASLRRVLGTLGMTCLVAGGVLFAEAPGSARQSKMVDLRYDSTQAMVPLRDIQALTEEGEVSEELQAYFDATPLTPEDGAAILSGEIFDGGIPIGRNDAEFLAIQITRSIGDRLGRERREAMFDALRASFADDRTITLLEVVENYPDSTVRVDFKRLDRLRTDVLLFVERISPVLAVIEQLLPELVCDCGFEDASAPTPALPDSPSSFLPDKTNLALSSHLTSGIDHDITTGEDKKICPADRKNQARETYRGAIAQLKAIVDEGAIASSHSALTGQQTAHWTNASTHSLVAQEPLVPLSLSGTSRIPTPIAENIIIAVGPIRPSFAIEDLDRFIETGVVPNGWRFYFSIAGVNAEEFRTALTEEVDVDVMFMDNLLNNILGEYILFQAGKIIHKPSEDSNIQALRSSIILSAVDDGKLSLLEFLRNYPSTDVVIEALNLARFGRNLSNQGVVGTATAGIEDLLLELQADVADDICNCENEE